MLVFAAVAARLFTPPWAWWSDQYATYMAWAGLASVLIYMAGQWRDVANFYKGRGARYGTMSLVSVVVFLGILVAVNYLSIRQNKRWDFTANQVYSLSDQTIKILKELKEPVTFVVFDRETNFDRFRDRLDEFAYQSTNVKTEYVDPDREPARAKEAAIQAYGTILIQYQGRTERVTSSEEQALTNGLIKAVTGATRKVYFTQGHGEKDTAATDRTGLSTIAQALSSDNYSVGHAGARAAEDRAGRRDGGRDRRPQHRLLPARDRGAQRLRQRRRQGHGDAGSGGQAGRGHASAADAVPHRLGHQGRQRRGARRQRHGPDARHRRVGAGGGRLPDAPDQRGLPARHGVPDGAVDDADRGRFGGHIAQPLVNTSPQSWAEADLSSLSGTGGAQVAFDADKGDRQGPDHARRRRLGAGDRRHRRRRPATATPASPDSERKPESRVVGIGDSDFAANYGLGIQGNRDFFMNAVNWLAQQENLIAIRPREPEDRRLTLTADQQQRIMLLCLFIIPGIVFASGVYTWWRRR